MGKGKKGQVMKSLFDFVMRNRTKIGAVLVALAAGLTAYRGDSEEAVHHASTWVAMAGTYLAGAGLHDSDATVHEKQLVSKQVDEIVEEKFAAAEKK